MSSRLECNAPFPSNPLILDRPAHNFSQLQTGVGASAEYTGMLDCFQKIIRNEGYVSIIYLLLALLANLHSYTDLLGHQILPTLPRNLSPDFDGGAKACDQICRQ